MIFILQIAAKMYHTALNEASANIN